MTKSANPLIVTCDTWEALLQAFAGTDAGRFAAKGNIRSAMGIIAAPAAIARWIATQEPRLATRPLLRLLIIGAEKLDAVDRGRWYQMIPALLGCAAKIEVTLVGDRLDREFRSPATDCAPQYPALEFCGSLAAYLDASCARAHDLAFLFHPGFQKHRGWLQDGSLARLAATGTEVVVTSYGADESEVDRRVAECYGFSATGNVLLNPYYIDLSDRSSSIQWGRALWQFGPQVPSSDHVPDAFRLRQLEQLAEMVMHSMAARVAAPRPYGARTEFRSGSNVRPLVHIFDDFFLDPSDGQVLAYRAGTLDGVTRLSAADVAAYPGDDRSDLDRALWAADVKARALLQLYPEQPKTADRHALARSMHSDLEDAVARWFEASC